MSLLVRFLFHSWFHIERHTVRNVNVNRLCVCHAIIVVIRYYDM